MMKNILVPVDFSKPSENALHVAVELARDNEAKITILHVVEIGESAFGTSQFNVDDEHILYFMKLAKKRFNAFLELDYLKDVAHEDVVDVGPTADVIIKNIAKRDIDIVVMGSTGASPDLLEEVFVGSNTDKIVGGTDVPVLVVKRKMENFDIKNVVFASNFKDESLDAFKKTKDFADSFGAKLKLLFVNLPSSDFLSSSEIRETMREFLNKTKIPLTQENIIVHNDYSLKEGVLNAAKENKADLIAMTTRGRSGIAYLINGSVADDVVKDSSLPVLTFKF